MSGPIWNFYDKVAGTHVATCRFCHNEYSYKTSVTNLKKHLGYKHKKAYQAFLEQTGNKSDKKSIEIDLNELVKKATEESASENDVDAIEILTEELDDDPLDHSSDDGGGTEEDFKEKKPRPTNSVTIPLHSSSIKRERHRSIKRNFFRNSVEPRSRPEQPPPHRESCNSTFALQHLENITNTINDVRSNQDEFYYFGQNVAAQLRSLPITNAVDVQAKIQALLSTERSRVQHEQQSYIMLSQSSAAPIAENSNIATKEYVS